MQSSLLNATLEDKNLSEIPNFRYVMLLSGLQIIMVFNVLSNSYFCCLDGNRLLLKQLVTMEVIQWTSLWEFFKDEYANEKNFLGGALGDKAAEDLKLRIIEHVLLT